VSAAERYQSADALLEDLRRVSTGLRIERLPERGDASLLWWWIFHQRAVTVADAFAPILVGFAVSHLPRQTGTWIFFFALALATVAVTLRLNLLFTAKVHPAALSTHWTKLIRWIVAAEAILGLLMLATGLTSNESRPILAGVLLCVAIVMMASLTLIEPATTASAGLTRKSD
jgi:hypothetical protein